MLALQVVAGASVWKDDTRPEPRTASREVFVDAYAAFLRITRDVIDPPAESAALDAGWRSALEAAGIIGNPQRSQPESAQTAIQADLDYILSNSRRPLSDRALVAAYINGMLTTVHQSHTGYYPVEAPKPRAEDEPPPATYYGFSVVTEDSGYRVWRVDPGSPAEEAGLHIEDLIVSINGERPSFRSYVESGASLDMVVSRGSANRKLQIIPVEDDNLRLLVDYLPGDICYIRIETFFGLGTELPKVKRCAEDDAGIILDLRSNPGGSVAEAAEVAGALGHTGTFVTLIDQDGSRSDYASRSIPARRVAPTVILVNRDSYSGAEILPFAMQESIGAIVLGEQTTGYARASTTFGLSFGLLQLPISRVLSPVTKTDIEGVGVTPDEEIELDYRLLRQGRDNIVERAVEIILGR